MSAIQSIGSAYELAGGNSAVMGALQRQSGHFRARGVNS